MRVCLLLLLSVAALGFAPAPWPKKDRLRPDLADVAGAWEFVAWESGGKRVESAERAYSIRMTRDKFIIVAKDRDYLEEYAMRLDPAASPPSFTGVGQGTSLVGSYRLQKDEITIIFNSG